MYCTHPKAALSTPYDVFDIKICVIFPQSLRLPVSFDDFMYFP
jgi:hypothetical protein